MTNGSKKSLNPIMSDCLAFNLILQSGFNNFRLQADTEKPEESRWLNVKSTTMKELTFNQMEVVNGGFNTFWRSACAVWAGISYFKLITYVTPATAALGKAVDITCIIVGIEAAAEALID